MTPTLHFPGIREIRVFPTFAPAAITNFFQNLRAKPVFSLFDDPYYIYRKLSVSAPRPPAAPTEYENATENS